MKNAMTGQAQTRRIQDTLTIAGSAAIAFSVWSLAKIGLFLMFVDESALRWLLGQLGIDNASQVLAVYVSLGLIALIDLGVRAYVGLSARAEGRGERRSPFYLVVAAIIAIMNASSLYAVAWGAALEPSPLSMAVSITIEATAIAALVLVVFSSVRLRRMGKAAG